MLELRPNCERCDRDLPPERADARICTFECTFCAECADTKRDGKCPNCAGNFTARPVRVREVESWLARRGGAAGESLALPESVDQVRIVEVTP